VEFADAAQSMESIRESLERILAAPAHPKSAPSGPDNRSILDSATEETGRFVERSAPRIRRASQITRERSRNRTPAQKAEEKKSDPDGHDNAARIPEDFGEHAA
jgi:hypothetical protein